MKKIILAICFIGFSAFLFAQDGAEQIITKKIGIDKVEINIGEQFEIKVDDVFQVFGKGQIIHPATGKLVERDNVYLGKIRVLEVKELSSIAEISEEKKDFTIGNKLVKVVAEDQQIVENKRPIQSEFENPKERNYSETIYTQQDKKGNDTKNAKIDSGKYIGLIKNHHEYSVIINQGKNANFNKNFCFGVFSPIYEKSLITEDSLFVKNKQIGKLRIIYTEPNIAKGILTLKKGFEKPANNSLNLLYVRNKIYRKLIIGASIPLFYVKYTNLDFYFKDNYPNAPNRIHYRIKSKYLIGVHWLWYRDDFNLGFSAGYSYRFNNFIEVYSLAGYYIFNVKEFSNQFIIEPGLQFYITNWMSINVRIPILPKPGIGGGLNFHIL